MYSCYPKAVGRVLDGWVKTRATFSDYAGVLKMMTASGQAAKMVLRSCTTEEFEAVAKSKCESLLLDLLKNALKNRSRRHKSLGDDESLLASLEAFDTHVHQDWFIPKSFQYSVEVVRDLVRSKTIDVLELKKRLRELEEEYIGNGEAPWNLIVEYVVGPGKMYDDEAACSMQSRVCETEGQELVNDLLDKVKNCSHPALGVPRGSNMLLPGISKSREVLSRKKKEGSAFTTTQSRKLSTYADSLLKMVSAGLRQELSTALGPASTLCSDALLNDGYGYGPTLVDQDDAGPSQKGLDGVLPMTDLRHTLTRPDITQQEALSKIVSKGTLEAVKIYEDQALNVYAIMGHVLNKTQAFAPLGYVPLKNLDFESAEGLTAWMQQLPGVDESPISSQWQTMTVLTKYSEIPIAGEVEALQMFKNLWAECKGLKFVGIEKEASDSLLTRMPKKSCVRLFLCDFFKPLREQTELMGAGHLAKPDQISTVQATAAQVLEKLPSLQTVSDQDSRWQEQLGLDEPPAMKAFVADIAAKAASQMDNMKIRGANALVASMKTASILLKQVSPVWEKPFRDIMREKCEAIAKAGGNIDQLLQAIKKLCHNIESYVEAYQDATASVQESADATASGQVVSSHIAAQKIRKQCVHYANFYVATTMYRHADIRHRNEKEAARGPDTLLSEIELLVATAETKTIARAGKRRQNI